MKKLIYADYVKGVIQIKEEDKKVVEKHFEEEIEMTIDEYGRVYNEGGQYIADIIN